MVIDFRTIRGDPAPEHVSGAYDVERITDLTPKTVIPIGELPTGVVRCVPAAAPPRVVHVWPRRARPLPGRHDVLLWACELATSRRQEGAGGRPAQERRDWRHLHMHRM